MLKVGLTGGIGSGKTTVSDYFQTLGVPVIDTDVIARELLNNDKHTIKEVIAAFGDQILNADGTIDRKKLANTVFNNNENKSKLEDLLHPLIREAVNTKSEHFAEKKVQPPYIVIVIPLLFETSFADITDTVVVVMADEATRIKRVERRDNRQSEEIQAIINNQVDDTIRKNQADTIIYNNQDINSLKAQVEELHQSYLLVR